MKTKKIHFYSAYLDRGGACGACDSLFNACLDNFDEFKISRSSFYMNGKVILKNEFLRLRNVTNKTTIKEAVHGADLVIIHTEWNDFKSINFKNLAKGKKFIVYDMRNIYSPNKIKEQGFKYYSIGR